jgi:hypothetical protein
MALNRDFLNISAIHRSHELAENDLRLATVLFIENAEYGEKNQGQDQP